MRENSNSLLALAVLYEKDCRSKDTANRIQQRRMQYLDIYKHETQLSLTNRATHLCKCDGVADLIKHTLSCYHAEFGRSALKGEGMNTGEPPKLGSPGTPLS